MASDYFKGVQYLQPSGKYKLKPFEIPLMLIRMAVVDKSENKSQRECGEKGNFTVAGGANSYSHCGISLNTSREEKWSSRPTLNKRNQKSLVRRDNLADLLSLQ